MSPRKYSDEQLAHAVATCKTMREILVQLGLAPYGGNYETVRLRIALLGLPASHLRTLRRGEGIGGCTDADIEEAVGTARSLAQAMAKLGIRGGGSQALLKKRIKGSASTLLTISGKRGGGARVRPWCPPDQLRSCLLRGAWYLQTA